MGGFVPATSYRRRLLLPMALLKSPWLPWRSLLPLSIFGVRLRLIAAQGRQLLIGGAQTARAAAAEGQQS